MKILNIDLLKKLMKVYPITPNNESLKREFGIHLFIYSIKCLQKLKAIVFG
jgi:hypothetical protein